ncbi:lysyl-tRNA synthetase [Dietzia sp. UCD-THP]|uniref:lysine--tRNA ligase n=1 Tax=Dietzia sp. UCD-THP TaxID=1292020 RepID=UPI00037DA04C|nr:lysine--tRNA ligase [Dietzia sp. UCD-THP]EYT62365.1 lysyl-tRNA synthetase [Dietzia sp. UCD-THP]
MTDTTPAAPGAASTEPASTEPADDTPEQLRIRRDKRQRILDSGVDAYPVGVPRTHGLVEIASDPRFVGLEPGEETDVVVSVAGRVLFVRNTGKLCFVRLQDGVSPEADLSVPAVEGEPDSFAPQLQAMLSLANVGEERLEAWKQDVDLGDHVSVTGRVVRSKRGELSVMADSWVLAAKSLRPLPVAHKELSEDTRVRQRYTDLIMRDTARRNAVTRIKVVRALRDALDRRGFLEVETPMLQTLHGGAAARPFVTHSNALDLDLYLRIAPELYLKRCVVGGIERVFEINRNFRNEGVDSSHSPEFAMLETYQAYGDYNTSATMIREVIQEVALEVFGSTTVTLADGTEYDLGGQWREMRMYPSLNEALRATHPELVSGDDDEDIVTVDSTVAELTELAGGVGLEVPSGRGWLHGKLVEELWEHLCGDQLEGPVFVRDFPVETSPLTRDHRTDRGVTEKWDLYVRGFELATGYSELVDPVIQRRRFEDQARLAAAGDDEAMVLDEDFLAAMEQGMPPTTGLGMGIDRLLMALTGLGIRETILFPMVKPLPRD